MFQSLISHVTKQKLPPAHQWLQKHIQVSELPFIIICKKNTDKDQTATCSYCPPVSMSSVMLKELCRVRYSMSQTCFSTVSLYLGKSPTACQYHHTKWSHGHVTGLKASYGFSPGHQQKWYASWTENDLACITFSSAQR